MWSARQLLAENRYLTLATAAADGTPWASPVWFAFTGDAFLWASSPLARHSVNIAARPSVGIVVFDSTVEPGHGEGLYVAASAAEVPTDEVGVAVAAYSAASAVQGLPAWTAADVTAPAKHRLYRAVVLEAFVLDDHDERVPVELSLARAEGDGGWPGPGGPSG